MLIVNKCLILCMMGISLQSADVEEAVTMESLNMCTMKCEIL